MVREMHRLACALLVVPMLAACQPGGARTGPRPVIVTDGAPPTPLWRTRIQDADLSRLNGLAASWAHLYMRLRPTVRHAQGPLLDPQAAEAQPAPPPGSYRCRTVRLRPDRGAVTAQTTAPGFCFVSSAEEAQDAAPLGIAKQTGSDIVAGYMFPDGRRYVFLGARQAQAGDNSLGYGKMPDRDVVGILERFGLFRWRLAIADGKGVTVYELTPVPADSQPKP